MELYFSPFACSLASHITAREAGLAIDLTPVTLSTKRTANGDDFLEVSPKGQVPVLRLDDGTILTEGSAVVQFLADQAPASGLMPPPGARERYAVLEWLNFVGTEIHKLCFHPMFAPDAPAESKAWSRGLLDLRLARVAKRMEGRSYVASEQFTVADAYLTWALTLCGKIGVDLKAHPALAGYLERMHARPAIQAAIGAEMAAASAAQ